MILLQLATGQTQGFTLLVPVQLPLRVQAEYRVLQREARVLIMIFTISFVSKGIFGQVDQPVSKSANPKVEVIAQSFGDSVMIRWAPTVIAWEV